MKFSDQVKSNLKTVLWGTVAPETPLDQSNTSAAANKAPAHMTVSKLEAATEPAKD